MRTYKELLKLGQDQDSTSPEAQKQFADFEAWMTPLPEDLPLEVFGMLGMAVGLCMRFGITPEELINATREGIKERAEARQRELERVAKMLSSLAPNASVLVLN